jgi:hypothetical protein
MPKRPSGAPALTGMQKAAIAVLKKHATGMTFGIAPNAAIKDKRRSLTIRCTNEKDAEEVMRALVTIIGRHDRDNIYMVPTHRNGISSDSFPSGWVVVCGRSEPSAPEQPMQEMLALMAGNGVNFAGSSDFMASVSR